MQLLSIIILGVVQGLTEFLPISSSGHLVVVEELLESATGKPLPNLLGLNIVLHAGTLLAVLVVFWNRIWRLAGEDRRTLLLLAVATLPAAVFGLILKKTAAGLLEDPLLAGCMLLVTGGLLLWGARHKSGQTAYQQLTYRQALLIGVSQAIAILPGMSRSGATIVTGLAVGLRPESAATFSFLLAVPAIAGASLLELISAADSSAAQIPAASLALGAAVSFGVGLFALRWLLRWLERGRLHHFAYWCLPLGVLVIVWQLFAG